MTDADLLHHSEPNTPVSSPDQPAPELPRSLGLRDLVLLNVVAVLSLRWLSTSAATGASALTLWVLAGLLFFVPMGLAVSELATRYPDEGGIYAWTKRAFGEGHGFLRGVVLLDQQRDVSAQPPDRDRGDGDLCVREGFKRIG